MRVVSLLPSATEIVLALAGLDALHERGPVRLVGRSHECDWPAGIGLEQVPALTAARTAFTTSAAMDAAVRGQLATGGSLYTLDEARLEALRPDLIITQDLCAVCSIDLNTVRAAAERMTPRPAVLSLNPHTFEGVLDDVLSVGGAIGMESRAVEFVVGLRERAARAQEHVSPYTDRPGVAVLEWTDPLFVAGHWTPQLVERAGGEHLLNPTIASESAGAADGPIGQTQRRAGKSIVVSPESLIASGPEFIIISPCGLALEQAWQEAARLAANCWWRDLPAVHAGRVAVVDGNQMFSRPGPRLVDGLEFLVGFINGREDLIPPGFPWRRMTS